MWHGLATWGLLIVAGIVLAMFGFSGVLGYGINAHQLVSDYVPNVAALAPTDLTTADAIADTMNGWFLIGALGSLITAVFGGWVGGMTLRRVEEIPAEEERERAYHRAA
jgi:hypothetical protein